MKFYAAIATLMICLFAMPAMAATCKISEYTQLGQDVRGSEIPVAREPSHAAQSVTYTTSTASSAFNSRTRFIRVICDAKAHFDFGGAPTATATSPEYFAVISGQKVAFTTARREHI